MYTEYFNLAELPFRITPDPRFLWYSGPHQEAKGKILYHITYSVGPIYLLADIGTGKTTIARRVAEELFNDSTKQVVVVNAPELRTANAFLRFVMEEFKVKTERSYSGSLKAFESFLLQQHEKRVTPVLLIDEAQNMSKEMLLLVQHLFNFSTYTEFLVQIVLFAQPELAPKLNRLKSLKSRMSIAYLRAFNLQETEEMLRFRWTAAGGKDFPFSEGAVRQIFEVAKGIPRAIVRLANESLLKTAVDNQRLVTEETVRGAAAELSLGDL